MTSVTMKPASGSGVGPFSTIGVAQYAAPSPDAGGSGGLKRSGSRRRVAVGMITDPFVVHGEGGSPGGEHDTVTSNVQRARTTGDKADIELHFVNKVGPSEMLYRSVFTIMAYYWQTYVT